MQRQSGLIFIETMLVIMVIGMIAAFGVMLYRRHAETTYLNKVAGQMQQFLKAALAYQADQHQWPVANNEPDCQNTVPDSEDTFLKNYVPNAQARSGFGAYFCWSSLGGVSDKPAHLFWVALHIPQNKRALGRRLVARLPNAILTADLNQAQKVPCDNGSCYVRMEVIKIPVISRGG